MATKNLSILFTDDEKESKSEMQTLISQTIYRLTYMTT